MCTPAQLVSRAARLGRSMPLFGVALLAVCICARGQEPDFRSSPPFTGKQIPVAPQQKSPWTPPPTTLPATLISASKALFEHGLADPRGCEYRQIEIGTGSCWSGDAGVVSTHGWVLPAADPATDAAKAQRFGVCWNGLVYPLVAVKDKADLQADVAALLAADERLRAEAEKRSPGSFHRWSEHAEAEGDAVSTQTMDGLKVCLLIRLGEEELAHKLWDALAIGSGNNDNKAEVKDPYLWLAGDLAWNLYDRSLCAHMRGDDGLALAGARMLIPLNKAIEAEARRRGIKPPNQARDPDEKTAAPYLEYLDNVDELLADQERRAKEGKHERAMTAGLEKIAAPKRIAALIRDLEEVSARQNGQPGGVDLASDPIVAALIKEGEAAVEPLLECLETDRRLTRSVHFGRDFSRYRSILGVHEAAYVALCGILEQSFFGFASTADDLSARGLEGRKPVAAAMRAHWAKFKGVPRHERWYAQLADDNAPPDIWAQAAANITRPVDVEITPGSMFGAGWITTPVRKPGEKPALAGEGLRSKKDPSVAQLLARRAGQIAQGTEYGSLHAAAGMAVRLSRWDQQAALPVLKQLFVTGAAKQDEPSVVPVVKLTAARISCGDKDAMKDYADWVVKLDPSQLSFAQRDVFQPLWRNPGDLAVGEALKKMLDKTSPWVPLIPTKPRSASFVMRDVIRSPLIAVPQFRERLIEDLADRTETGSVRIDANGALDLRAAGWSSGGQTIPQDPLLPPEGKTVTTRICDVIAQELSHLDGAPQIALYWPVEKRDAAIASMIAFLKQYGDAFRYNPELDEDDSPSRSATFRLNRLKAPATAEDVKAGRAIFTLAGEGGESRVWAMSEFPLKARWITHKAYPRWSQTYDPKEKKTVSSIEYMNEGHVWQAEELIKNGKTELFLGFVGRHTIARVPAGEIEFPGAWPWMPLGDGLDCRVDPPGPGYGESEAATRPAQLNQPLPLKIGLRSRLAVPKVVPTEFCRGDAKGAISLREGVQLKLWYAPPVDPLAANRRSQYEDSAFTEVKPKSIGRFTSTEGSRTLSPTEHFVAVALDLNDAFDIQRPGRYRVQVTFDPQVCGLGSGGQSMAVDFTIWANPATRAVTQQ